MTTPPRYRPLTFGVTRVKLRQGAPGTQYLVADQALHPCAQRLTDRLIHWAETTPERTLFAQRERLADGSTGDWQHVSYREALARARSVAQALLDRGLSAKQPVAILSENGLDHALIALGCLYAGVPYCSVSPAYSTISQDFAKLRHVLNTITPGLVYANDAARYGKAMLATVPASTEIAFGRGSVEGRTHTTLDALLHTTATPAVETAMQAVGPDTVAKFLFTSGSTKLPKAVINTQRMWCHNQQQMRQSMPVLTQDPPVLIDWLPWNHTFGGNHNFGLVVYNGGTLYIDDGKPTPALLHETLRNLREISPTLYFNVPTGFEGIAQAMKTDAQLRKTLLARVQMFFYAGAALAQPIWDSLFESAEQEVGERIVMTTGLGMTESSPYGIFVTSPNVKAGDLGVPTPGLELKLVEMDGKTEVRYRGPNITPGYWRDPATTAEAFDEEGFFCTGDAVKWIDPDDIHQGLKFDGRIAEDFKLATGTFVSVGPLRAKIIAAGAPYIQDVVITGLNMHEVGAMVFPTPLCHQLVDLPAGTPWADVLHSPPVREKFVHVLDELAKTATGSASRVARAVLLTVPPSIDLGEITDKGSINQRAVLKHRDALVQGLHDGSAEHILLPTH